MVPPSSRENDYLVGLSIDGPRELHDAYRHDQGGRPVFDRVVAAARRLQKHGAEFNVLCTVNAANAGHPLEVYRFFRDELGARFIQLIPIVEVETPPHDGRPGTVTDRSVQPADYGSFLNAIFDEWLHHDVGEMFVQTFDGVLAAYVRGTSSLCIFQPDLRGGRRARAQRRPVLVRPLRRSPRTCSATSRRRRSASSCAPSSSARSGAPSRRRCPPSAAPASTSSPATASAPRTASC